MVFAWIAQTPVESNRPLRLDYLQMFIRQWIGASVLAVFFFTEVAAAQAQGQPPYDAAIDLQLFEYAIGPRSFLTVTGADVAHKDQLSADVLLTYLTNPFTIYDVDPNTMEITGERAAVVKTLLAGELSAAYGLTDRLQLGLSLPLVFSMSGDGLDPGTARPSAEGLQASGLGDMRVELKARLWASGNMGLAASGGLTLPTSVGTGGSDFLGDDLPSVRGRFAFQWENQHFSAGANLGAIARKPRTVYATTVGQQLVYGAAGAVKINQRVSGIAELFGRTGVISQERQVSPLELSGAVRIRATKIINVLAGGGAGVGKGVGTPDLRVFLAVGWAPDSRDDDGDGISNLNDRCPLEPEDIDGFEDDDGCPDLDNDGDLRPDAEDKCPNEKEDLDGFEDDDGCPDLDNDGDGIPDTEDRCPNEAEDGLSPGAFATDGCPASRTDADFDGIMDDVDKCMEEAEDMDGFEDEDGCPDLDNDGDGVPDAVDKCPLCAEDRDGFEDEDGCPDLDNDKDGIPDSRDACPMEAETINGVQDEDGCPDQGGKQLAYMQDDRLVLNEEIKFRRDRLRGGAQAINQAATIMKANPDVTRWLIAVGAKVSRGKTDEAREQAQKRAEVIKAQLLSKGVDAARIMVVGAPSDRDAVVIQAKERAEPEPEAPFECPAELQVHPRAR
jgi:OmpA-OmpF porin, OOP family